MLNYLPSQKGFLGLDPEDAGKPEDSKALIIPFGLEKSVSYEGGTQHGPQAIIDASPELEYFDEVLWCEPFRKYGIATLSQPHIPNDLGAALAILEKTVEDTLTAGHFPLIFGGEHSLTPAALRPHTSRHEKITVLQFDAHADLRDGYLGEKNSHAAAMCRVLDCKNINLVSVGIRNISAEELPILETNQDRIDIFWAKDKRNWHLQDMIDAVGSGPVYITFDLDGFDSSLMPATGTPEPGGLFWDEVMDIISAISKNANIIGADIVELAPRDGLHACDFLAAKLTYKILSYALLS